MKNNPPTLSQSAPTKRILVVDDHHLLLDMLTAALGEGGLLIVETVDNIAGALSIISESGRFDAVLLDYEVPGMDDLDGFRLLNKANCGSVALFSGVANWAVAERFLDAGAAGFIPKNLPFRTLKHAVNLISEGDFYIPMELMRRMSDGSAGQLRLKPREMRVLGLLCEGMQNKQIGKALGVDESTIKMDVQTIFRHLGVRNRTQAAIAAMKRGLL